MTLGERAAVTALRLMFAGKWFSISAVVQGWEAVGIPKPEGLYRTLRPLHCVNWADMPEGLPADVMRAVLESFGWVGADVPDMVPPGAEAPLVAEIHARAQRVLGSPLTPV